MIPRLLFALLVLSLAACANVAPEQGRKRIAFSFDDVPRHDGAFFSPDERAAALIAALRRGRVRQAGFFVTTGNLDRPAGAG
ncbi:MAG TPA: polysaccharide deacetylase, partial [Allosphingosinicella sp.]|nr:polysaccharide deacetylase [Allosphingosinicella sp.]